MSDRHRIQTMCTRLPRSTLARVDEEFCCLIRIQGMTSLIQRSRYSQTSDKAYPSVMVKVGQKYALLESML